MGDETKDLFAALRAEVDQAKEGMKSMSQLLGTYYAALKEDGFTEEEAFALVVGFQQQMLINGQSDG